MKTRIVIAAAIVLLATVAPQALATEELRKELAVVAGGVAKALKAMGNESVSIGEFTGPSNLSATASPLLAKLLTEELGKLDVAVKSDVKMSIKGEYLDITDAATGKLAAQIKGEVLDRSGRAMFTFARRVSGDLSLASLFGISAELKPDGGEKARNEQLLAALDNPEIQINDARISASPKSPYAIEVLVKAGNQYLPRPAVNEEGLAFVKLGRNDVYAVRLINNSPLDASVVLTIDGLNMFAFSDRKDYNHVIIPAGKSGVIFGWHRSNQVSDSFLVTEYAKSEAARLLPQSAAVGTITAAFSAAWPADAAPPADEPAKAKGVPSEATGRGAAVGHVYQEVLRHTGVVRSTVSVRYSKLSQPGDLPP
jgi:hypothetical protein